MVFGIAPDRVTSAHDPVASGAERGTVNRDGERLAFTDASWTAFLHTVTTTVHRRVLDAG
ncbi:DUF397 domain-containing protein [Streptomyces sp. RM99]|nr:DUF397 domain-containing protein [Streptomyces sp. RM99]